MEMRCRELCAIELFIAKGSAAWGKEKSLPLPVTSFITVEGADRTYSVPFDFRRVTNKKYGSRSDRCEWVTANVARLTFRKLTGTRAFTDAGKLRPKSGFLNHCGTGSKSP